MYLTFRSLKGYVENINGSDDRYTVIKSDDTLSELDVIWGDVENKISDLVKKDYDKVKFESIVDFNSISLENKYKIRFSSDTILPLNDLITFYSLTLIIRCVIEKNGKFYPLIYLDDAVFEDSLIKWVNAVSVMSIIWMLSGLILRIEGFVFLLK